MVDPCKITTIIAMLALMEIKQFLVTTSFYRHSFRNFANKVTPQCKLLKKDEEFLWTKACAKSWEWMKTSMTCLCVLIVPDWKLEFHMHIDASKFALRAMLSQNPN
jgi:hypothetical protein